MIDYEKVISKQLIDTLNQMRTVLEEPIVLIPLVISLLILWVVLTKYSKKFSYTITGITYAIISVLIVVAIYVFWVEGGNIEQALSGFAWLLARLYVVFGGMVSLFLAINFYLLWQFSHQHTGTGWNLYRLYKSSYLFNVFIIAIPLIVVLFFIASVSNLNSSKYEVHMLVFISLVIPTIFGYYKAAAVGIWCGIIGIYVGLFVYSLSVGGFQFWLDNAFWYFALNIFSQQAGWFGSWAIRGQTHLSASVSVCTVKVPNLQQLFQIINSFERIVSRIYSNKFSKTVQMKKVNKDYSLTFESDGTSSIADYHSELIWRTSFCPPLDDLQASFKRSHK